ncbi:Hemicentin-1 [Durusdinium trenchii]|uniref:Hemicentin-1 n=2 Tax=Durusdinium trenchii TaxID=1381693 RepID=A0ABP0I709_9DINO
MFAPVPSLEAPRVATSSGNAANTAVWAEGSASAAPLRSRWTGKWQPTWGPGVGVLAALASHTARRARRSPGGPSGPAVREQKRAKKAERERRLEKFRSPYVPNRHEPPPLTARGAPKTGAWENGTPETEQMRQGQFTSPWTGQVYDRWSAEGRLQRNTDRQGGLARSRAYETPTQRQIATAVEERDSDHTPEWAKYYPGLAPVDKLPLTQRRTGAQVQTFDRHAYRAGNFGDIFKQLLVHTIVELKVEKKESPVWYVEPCGGEGEYHVSRMRGELDDRPSMRWPKAEDLYSVLQDQDLTYMPPEVKGWMETVQMLNFSEDMEFEETGEGADKAPKGIQWLPSTTMVALRLLRKQDPVTIWEDSRRAFAPLFNFVRNWSSKVQPHIELIFKDGLKHCHRRWVQHKPGSISEVYGKYNGQRGVVFIDPDYTRGGEAERCKTLIVDLWKHWRSATVVITYPIGPQYEKKARDFNMSVRRADKTLDLMTIEAYVENKAWHEDSKEDRWRGYGALISQPPHTTAERTKAALKVVCDSLATMPEAEPIHFRIEKLRL